MLSVCPFGYGKGLVWDIRAVVTSKTDLPGTRQVPSMRAAVITSHHSLSKQEREGKGIQLCYPLWCQGTTALEAVLVLRASGLRPSYCFGEKEL